MRVGGLPTGYKTFPNEPLDKAALAACTNDDAKERKIMLAVQKETLNAINKRRLKHNASSNTVVKIWSKFDVSSDFLWYRIPQTK